MKNKILIAVFIIGLLGPTIAWMCVSGYISAENTENRTLAEKPELTLADFSDYPQSYEDYYNDHLPFKSQLVNWKTKIEYKIFGTVDSKKVLLGKDQWLFFIGTGDELTADEQPISDYQGINYYTDSELEMIADNIKAVDEYLESRDTDFSVLIAPNKEHIYSEYLPDDILKINEATKADKLVSYLQDNTESPVMYPVDELIQYKDEYQLYYKYDSHWNNLGGFIGAQQINALYKGESDSLDDYQVTVTGDEPIKDLAIMLNMEEEFTGDSLYYVEDYKSEVTAELTDVLENGFIHVYHSDAEDERTLLVLRDSYGELMMSAVARNFQNVIFVHRNVFQPTYLDQYQPDVVVYQVVERATNDMMDLKAIFGL